MSDDDATTDAELLAFLNEGHRRLVSLSSRPVRRRLARGAPAQPLHTGTTDRPVLGRLMHVDSHRTRLPSAATFRIPSYGRLLGGGVGY